MISNIYAECDDYGQSQCNNDNNCEWIENIETEWCSGNNQAECFAQEECYWYPGGIYLGSQCTGGSYEVDNSYCQEIEMLECSEMNETECSSDDVCEWVEDIEIGQCSQFDNSENSCTSYLGECYWDEDITYGSCSGYSQGSCNNIQGCYWDCSNYYNWDCGCYGQEQFVDTECIGQYDIDNSYCQEIEILECSDMNEIQCNAEDGCSWYDDVDSVSCGSLSVSECSQYFDEGCSLDADCIQWGSWYTWICYEYGPSYCTGGNIDIDNSICEETQYQLGDINGDSAINILDVIATVSLIQDGAYDLVVDIDSNGVVNILDVIQLINIILDRS